MNRELRSIMRVTMITVLVCAASTAQPRQTLFRDDFNRPNSQLLGPPWTEGAELTTETYIQSRYVGPGFIEVESGTMTFHYTTHSLRPYHLYESTNADPYAFAPLLRAVNKLPAGLSATFIPNPDERTILGFALMSGAEGVTNCHSPIGGCEPVSGILVGTGRSSWGYNNSNISIWFYEHGVSRQVANGPTPFQFNSGSRYRIELTIQEDQTIKASVTDGISTTTITSAPIAITTPLDTFVLVDGESAISYDSSSPGDYLLRVDDIEVWQANRDALGPITSNVLASPDPVAIYELTSLTADVDDATQGGSNVAAARYNIDGGSLVDMTAIDLAFNSVRESVAATPFSISTTGVHSVCVRGQDSIGNIGPAECIMVPVYDPNGGFTTGGGKVESPAGSDFSNPLATGMATFGFVSKYLPGKSTPDGNLEFQFQAGNLNFKSTSMDWLVVTGEPRSIFRGTGAINGGTVCKFEVDAWDGSFSGTSDAFGLTIFSCQGGGDRYRLPARPIAKGSIIIHK